MDHWLNYLQFKLVTDIMRLMSVNTCYVGFLALDPLHLHGYNLSVVRGRDIDR